MNTIQRILASLGIVFVITLLVLTMLVCLARSAKVQTATVSVVAEQLSRGLNTRVEVGELDYKFPNSLLVHHVLVEDQMADTLLYVDTLAANASLWQLLLHDTIIINDVALAGARMHVYRMDAGSVWNYQYLLDAFKTNEEKQRNLALNMRVDQIRLSRLSMQYEEWGVELPEMILHLQSFNKSRFEAEIARCEATLRRANLRPLEVRALEAHVVATDSLLSFPKLHVALPRTDINAKELYIDHGEISVHVPDAKVTPGDLAAVLPALRSMNAPWNFSASINGNIDSLNASQLALQYRGKDVFKGDLTVLRLPTLYEKLSSLSVKPSENELLTMDTAMIGEYGGSVAAARAAQDDQPYVRAHCEDFILSKATLQDVISSVQGRPVALPEMLTRLGKVHYKGALEGRLNDLQLRGAFSSNLGSVRTEGWASIAKDFSEFNYKGMLSTKRFQVGKLLDMSDLGTVGFTINSNGHVGNGEHYQGELTADLAHLDYKDYTYQNVHLDGTIHDRAFNGVCRSKDPNIAFTLDSRVTFDEARPSYNVAVQLEHLRFGELHLSERYADCDLRFRLATSVQGNQLDSLSGKLTVDDLCFAHPAYHDSIVLKELTLSVDPGSRPQTIRLSSDYVNASMQGEYQLTTLPISLKKLVAAALPSLFSLEEQKTLRKTETANNVEFYVFGRHLDHISRVLALPVSIPDMPTIKGSLVDASHMMSLRMVVPELWVRETHVEGMALSMNADAKHTMQASLYAMLHHSDVPASEKMGDLQLYLDLAAARDSLVSVFSWANVDTLHNVGDFRATTRFSRYANQPMVTVNMQPSQVIISDSTWMLRPARLTYTTADTTLLVDHFLFGSQTQSIFVDGIASTHMEDTLRVELQDVALNYFLNTITDLAKTITFGGNVTGWANAYGIFKAPMFEAEVAMKDAEINNSLVGDVHATATLDSLNRVIINGDVYDWRLPSALEKPTVHVDGLVGDAYGHWRLDIYPDSVELGFVNHWVSSFLSDISGRATGYCKVWGYNGKQPGGVKGVWVEVKAKACEAGLTIPFTGGRYFINDSVLMDSTSILFPRLTARDKEGNPVEVYGEVHHDGSFKSLTYDVHAEPKRAIVLDLLMNGEDLYSGKVYGNGVARVWGDDKTVHVMGDAVTTGGKFMFSLGGASTANENSFIEFVSHDEVQVKSRKETESPVRLENVTGSSLDLTLQVEVTPAVDVVVLLDTRTGDGIKGQGEGNLRLHLTDTESSVLGSIALQRGTFGFTFQNVIHRDFQIAEGSSVTWTGNPENPELDVRALYRVSASLRDLFGADAPTITSRSSVPVHCVLNVTDRLATPAVRFGIELPSSDESVANEVRSIINTEEMLTRQVLYLLIFSRFYTPEYVQQKGSVGVNETYSLISSTVTGQINSWISRLTDAVQVGFNVRSEGVGAAQEYEAQFEFHPVRGLIINGNFGYRYNDLSNQPIFGNLDVEYMITENGKLRVKGYTHTVDKYSLRQASTVQGVGFVFKHDYNWGDAKKARENR